MPSDEFSSSLALPETVVAEVIKASPNDQPAAGEMTMTLREFAERHIRSFGPLMGGFVHREEAAGRLAGRESQWLRQIALFANEEV